VLPGCEYLARFEPKAGEEAGPSGSEPEDTDMSEDTPEPDNTPEPDDDTAKPKSNWGRNCVLGATYDFRKCIISLSH